MTWKLPLSTKTIAAWRYITAHAGKIIIVRNRAAHPWHEFEVRLVGEPDATSLLGHGADRFEAIDDAQAHLRARGSRLFAQGYRARMLGAEL